MGDVIITFDCSPQLLLSLDFTLLQFITIHSRLHSNDTG